MKKRGPLAFVLLTGIMVTAACAAAQVATFKIRTEEVRIDLLVTAGRPVQLVATGTNPSVQFRLTNLLVDRQGKLTVYGTEGDDTFQLLPDGLPYIKGTTETYIPTLTDRFDGGAGEDRVLFLGGDDDRLGRPVPDSVAVRWSVDQFALDKTRYSLFVFCYKRARAELRPSSFGFDSDFGIRT